MSDGRDVKRRTFPGAKIVPRNRHKSRAVVGQDCRREVVRLQVIQQKLSLNVACSFHTKGCDRNEGNIDILERVLFSVQVRPKKGHLSIRILPVVCLLWCLCFGLLLCTYLTSNLGLATTPIIPQQSVFFF